VRKECVIILSWFVESHMSQFVSCELDLVKDEKRRQKLVTSSLSSTTSSDGPSRGRNLDSFMTGSSTSSSSNWRNVHQSEYSFVLKALLSLSVDGFPLISALASHVVDGISMKLISTHPVSIVPHSESLKTGGVGSSSKYSSSSGISTLANTSSSTTNTTNSTLPVPLKSSSTPLKRSSSIANSLKSLSGLTSFIASLPGVGFGQPISAHGSTSLTSVDDDSVRSSLPKGGADESTGEGGSTGQAGSGKGELKRRKKRGTDLSVYMENLSLGPSSSTSTSGNASGISEKVSLNSTFFHWSLEYFTEPQMRVSCQQNLVV
jgi:hypothetical protein